MTRYYMALGPFDSRETAERARAGMTESDALRASVLRLRDRTGPSVAARLAKLEEHARRFDLNEHHARLAAVQDALAHLETEHTALVERVGELERLPVESDTARMLAALRGLGDGDARNGFAAMMGDPAPVRPEPGSVAEPTDEELGRLVRGLFFEGEDVEPFESLPEDTRNDYARAGKVLYDLGRERGSQGRTALLNQLHVTRRALAEEQRMSGRGLAIRDELTSRCAAMLARTEKAEGMTTGARSAVHTHVLRSAVPFCVATGRSFALAEDAMSAVVADWQKRGEELEALRSDLASLSAEMGLPPGMRPAEGELARLFGTRPSAPTPIERAEMAAELEAAGWLDCTTGWADTHGDAAGLSLNQAHAAMRAAKGAK